MLRLLPLLCCRGVVFLLVEAMIFLFLFLFLSFLFFRFERLFLKFWAKKTSLTDETPAKKTQKEAAKEIWRCDWSLLKPRAFLSNVSLFFLLCCCCCSLVEQKESHALPDRLKSPNERMISKRLSDLRLLLWSDVRSSKTPLSFDDDTNEILSFSLSLLSLSKSFLNKTLLPNARTTSTKRESLALVEHFFVRFCSRNALRVFYYAREFSRVQ